MCGHCLEITPYGCKPPSQTIQSGGQAEGGGTDVRRLDKIVRNSQRLRQMQQSVSNPLCRPWPGALWCRTACTRIFDTNAAGVHMRCSKSVQSNSLRRPVAPPPLMSECAMPVAPRRRQYPTTGGGFSGGSVIFLLCHWRENNRDSGTVLKWQAAAT